MADDDPYLTLGKKMMSGAASSQEADPYLSLGKKMMSGTVPPPEVTTPAADGSTPYTVENSWLGIPLAHDFAAGVTQGVRNVASTGANVAKWVDARVPILASVDRAVGLDPEAASRRLEAARTDYEASPEGQSYAGTAGKFVGEMGASAPLLGVGGRLAASGVGLAADAVGGAAGRAIVGAGNLMSGTAAVPEAGFVPNLLTKASSRALQGAGVGAAYGALSSGGSDSSIGENVLAATKGGMIAGPALGAAGDILGGTGRIVSHGYNAVTGRVATQEVADTIAAARARAAAVTPTPEEGAGATGGASAGPQAGGAAATSEADLAANAPTASQAEAQRLRAFDLRMKEQAKPGEDWTEYVEGSRPTLAEGLADPHLAAIQRNVLPGDQRAANLTRENNMARQDHLDNIRGDPVTLENLEAARSDQATQDLQTAWAGAKDTTAEPVMQHINDELAGSAGKLTPVKSALNEVSNALHNSDGELETDPKLLYGARRQITYMLSKTGRTANPAYGDGDVMRALISTRDVLDKQILDGASKFQTFLDNFRAASPEIDKQDYLQGFNVAGADGNIQLSRVNTMLKTIRGKLAAPGANPAKSLDESTLDALFNLRADLLRENNRTLAAPAGSPTSFNQGLGAELGINAAHTGMRAVASQVPLAGPALDASLARMSARNVQRTREGYIQNLLAAHPMTPPNQLTPP